MAYLIHHGIKGQRWGIRRYQNEDGSYTDAGLSRYQRLHGDRMSNLEKQRKYYATSAVYKGKRRNIGEFKEDKLRKRQEREQNKYASLTERGKTGAANRHFSKAEKFGKQADERHSINEKRKSYDEKTSARKMERQNFLFGGKQGGEDYRDARAQGKGRLRSAFGTSTAKQKRRKLLANLGVMAGATALTIGTMYVMKNYGSIQNFKVAKINQFKEKKATRDFLRKAIKLKPSDYSIGPYVEKIL